MSPNVRHDQVVTGPDHSLTIWTSLLRTRPNQTISPLISESIGVSLGIFYHIPIGRLNERHAYTCKNKIVSFSLPLHKGILTPWHKLAYFPSYLLDSVAEAFKLQHSTQPKHGQDCLNASTRDRYRLLLSSSLIPGFEWTKWFEDGQF